ncbi:MAG: hypothetical protein LBF93_07705 [Zoogloeaceae bacterium]|jgi:ribosomal protein S18 acetylase RimI-like enzyme|nr:hypothetical protein [Zoogloeaceae bacterium]
MSIAELIGKIRRKGWRGVLRVLRERFIYQHWELLALERSLDLPLPRRMSAQRWAHARISSENLPKLEKYFSRYLSAMRELLKKGLRGEMFVDENGNAIGIMWMTDRDYYDNQLYHCKVRLPPGCVYLFAVEIAKPYRGIGLPLLCMRLVCEEFPRNGVHAVRSLVDARNLPALSMNIRLGFVEVGEVTHAYRLFHWFHFARTRAYPSPRFLHLRRKGGKRITPDE